jgi:DNA-binding Xre family transcriptional regulator
MADYNTQLRSLMQPIGLNSFRALSRAAGVSEWQVELLRKGQVAQMRVEILLKLSRVLQLSISELVERFSSSPIDPSEAAPTLKHRSESIDTHQQEALQQLRQEYQRLQTQLEQQRATLEQEFQQATLQILESWLLQFPTAAYAAQQNPELPATKLLPLMRPIEQLLNSWGIEMLAPVGTELAYDPQEHQLLQGTANPGDQVKVRNPGYRQGSKLLYRAKVSPVQ